MRIFTFLITLIVFSCKPPVVFEQSYPTTEEDLSHIPELYQGTYICESDSALFVISAHTITMNRTHYFNTSISTIEERAECKIVDDKMYVSGREECIPISIINDSIVRGTYKEIDTLFTILEGSNVRLYKGHLVINQEISSHKWAVSLLSYEQGGDLLYRAITNKTKIKNVKQITKAKDITTKEDKKPRYSVRPTMKEFDALLKDEKVFVECEYLTKVDLRSKKILN